MKESSRALYAFQFYRDLGPDRSLALATRKLNELQTKDGQITGKRWHIDQLGQWSSKHKWQDRLQNWEMQKEEEYKSSQLQKIRDMARRHESESQLMQAVGLRALNPYNDDKAARVNPTLAMNLMVKGIELERLTIGEPTAIIDQRGNIPTIVNALQVKFEQNQHAGNTADKPKSETPGSAG